MTAALSGLQITQQPSTATDGLAFNPPIVVQHPLGAAADGQTATIVISSGANGVPVGSTTAIFTGGLATFATFGIDDTTL